MKKKKLLKKKTSAKKTKAVKPKTEALRLINLKVSEKERGALQALADKYTHGNISEWLRIAGRGYEPPASRKDNTLEEEVDFR